MMAHLGLDPEPGQRNQTQLDSVRHGHATSSTVSASVARWRKDLSAADVKIVETICEPIMRECGYAASAD